MTSACWAPGRTETMAAAADLIECLVCLPSLVSRLDSSRPSGDLNLIEVLTSRTEEYIELLLLLTGSLL